MFLGAAIVGCDGDGDNGNPDVVVVPSGDGGGTEPATPPENISGEWAAVFTDVGGTDTLNETMVIAQVGTSVSGSYTFGMNNWTFSGTYVNGTMTATDNDGWTIEIEFLGNSGAGRIYGSGDVWAANLSR